MEEKGDTENLLSRQFGCVSFVWPETFRSFVATWNARRVCSWNSVWVRSLWNGILKCRFYCGKCEAGRKRERDCESKRRRMSLSKCIVLSQKSKSDLFAYQKASVLLFNFPFFGGRNQKQRRQLRRLSSYLCVAHHKLFAFGIGREESCQLPIICMRYAFGGK